MKFTPLSVDGVHLVEMERREDERGWFARGFAVEEFAEHVRRGELHAATFQ